MTTPITPNDLRQDYPDGIKQAINARIQETWNGTTAQFSLEDLILTCKLYVPFDGPSFTQENRAACEAWINSALRDYAEHWDVYFLELLGNPICHFKPRQATSHPVSHAIAPADVKPPPIPKEIFDAFNELIAEKIRGGSATLFLKEVYKRCEDKFMEAGFDPRPEADRKKKITKGELRDLIADAIYNHDWLNVAPSYREQGWTVTYDRPGFNETFQASYEFRKPKV